ncbi:MAG: tetratricopeptide repeat protein [Candidatus Goldbacteria bacterium]|nr:tetratricopeptide repeat protein [Candidatus Goldiibacteriota bacterium]HPD18443.1 tetratricopeptide repeat protein [Candidatus Goldiibacteriota bacterium]
MPGDTALTAEIEELKKKLSQNPDSLIFVPLADAYRKAGLHDEAVEVCKKGLEKHPSYTSARVVLGRIYIEKNKFDEAIQELQRVEAVDADNIMVHIMLGNTYLKKKMYAEAVEQFQKVISINPEDVEIQEKLKEALSAKQETTKIVKEEEKKETETPVKKQEKPVEKPKIDVQKSLKAAELYTKKEDFEKAIEIYRELLDMDQENIVVQQRLREVYDLQDKRIKKAKEKSGSSDGDKIISSDKITTEDILDVMKEAVESDKVDEEENKTEKKEERPETEKPVETAQATLSKEKTKDIEKILNTLKEVDGIIGSFFLLRDGSIIASVLPPSININEIGKHIAAIVEKTEKSVQNMNQGKLNQVVISSESGQLLFTEVMSGVLFMIGDETINVGKMHLILKDIISNLKKVLS